MFLEEVIYKIHSGIMMRKAILRSKIKYLVIGITITTLGTVLFFPLTIDGRYTCFYHRFFNHTHPVSDINMIDQHQEGNTELSKSGNHDLENQVRGNDKNNTSHHGSVLLDNYLHQYAFPWWASIGLLTLCIYLVLRLKKNITENDSSLIAKQ